jgi:FkbM family methyltransferase
MKTLIRRSIQGAMSLRGINSVLFGKNSGLKIRYSRDLNIDMLLGLHEPNTFEVFDIFVKEGMVVADIGANIGYFSRFLSQKAGATGSVHCFEPIPSTFNMLKDTIELNKLTNITAVNKAVSSSNGTITMYLSHTHYMASVDSNWAGSEGGNTEVPTVTLDSYFEALGQYPDFIKMDIEGGGVFALKGMRDCIVNNEPILLLESHTSAEDYAIGAALSLIPYDVYRVGNSAPVTNLKADHKDPGGIYDTVVGIPKSKRHLFPNWTPAQFQKKRAGQRA